jgi:hypothetical protein
MVVEVLGGLRELVLWEDDRIFICVVDFFLIPQSE